LNAGYSVIVWNRSQPGIDECVGYGAVAGTSPRDVAEKSDLVITMVMGSEDVRSVVLGPNGIIEGAHPGLIVIDTTTISPKVSREIAEKLRKKGVRMLDAPVSGFDIGAKAGTLTMMVGGPEDTFQKCLPIFNVLGEGAIIVVCAASGVEVGSEQVWAYSEEANLPRLIFINKMDRENADFYKTLEQVQSKFGSKCLPIQLPIGAHNSFEGIVDLLTMKSYIGSPIKEAEIPPSLQTQASSFREKLVEAVAETDDKLIEKYLNGEELSLEELSNGLRQAIVTGTVVPVLIGSAIQSIGII
ncbi:unnamed protein product, partial [marine sediment metagenome]